MALVSSGWAFRRFASHQHEFSVNVPDELVNIRRVWKRKGNSLIDDEYGKLLVLVKANGAVFLSRLFE
jgi:hypothetical protein